jgi:hypothetical protein
MINKIENEYRLNHINDTIQIQLVSSEEKNQSQTIFIRNTFNYFLTFSFCLCISIKIILLLKKKYFRKNKIRK